MPELPEVETIRRTLAPHLVGRTIEGVEVRTPKFVVGPSPEAFRRAVEGLRVAGLARRGKYLIISLEASSGASAGEIIVHLKMAGQLLVAGPETGFGPVRDRHTHVVFRLDDGRQLRYVDTRHFGRLYFAGGGGEDPVLSRALKTVAGLGPEPRPGDGAGELDWPAFRRRLATRKGRLKPLLLDQSFVAGLGNIYADECLFRAGLHPLRRSATLSETEARALFDSIEEVIGEAIEHGGTSIRDYVDGEGREGRFASRLRVYRRTGEPCPRCGTPIERTLVGGRGTHFCPRCQPPPA